MKPLIKTISAVALLGLATQAFGQLQWSSYDTSGNLVTANVASGGDVASGTSVSFTIPAGTQLFFVTKNFTPIILSQANASAVVTFKFSASAGITGVNQRTVEWGLYNSSGTASLADDIGMYGGWEGTYVEGIYHAAGSANLFTGISPGLGKTTTGTPTDGTTYTNQIRLYLKTAPIGVALGSSSSSLGAAGIAMNGADLVARGYTNPENGTNTFDEFALMFNNTTASPVTVTLSAIGLGNSLTWDASGANPTAPTDGSGNWSSINANWSGGAGGAIGASDSIWSPNYSAVIGVGNGAAGTITNNDAAGEIVSNITFNAAGSGSYNITGSPLILTGTPTITVASGVTATNSAPLGGTGFIKAGNGTFVLSPSVAATNVGATVVNAGTLFLDSTAVNSLNDSVVVNPGATLLIPSSLGMNSSSTLTINGGSVTNLGLNGTSTETHNLLVFDNNGNLAYGPSGSGQLNATNFDFRSGFSDFPKMIMTTNFSVKSTPGTMDFVGRPSSTGPQGLILTLLGGTMLLDYPLVAPNNDTTQGGAKLQQSSALTLGGGTLLGLFNSTASRTEKVIQVVILPGATSFFLTNNAGSYGFTQGALNRSVGGTINYGLGGTGSLPLVTTTSANVNGILGGWATFAGSDWAVGTTIGAYSAYTTSTDPSTWVATNNVSLTGNPLTDIPNLTAINTLKLAGASAVTLDGSLTLSSGGLLVTGTGANSITGGTLLGGSGADLIVHQYGTGDLTIGSTLADNGTATSLTKSGSGKLIITGTDNMTGNNYLNGGTVEVSDLSQLASGSLVMNNGILRYTGSDATSTRQITMNGVGGTIDVAGDAKLIQTGVIVGSGGLNSPLTPGLNLGDWGGLTKIGSGTLMLAINNIYNGPTIVSNGVLSVNGTNSLTGTSGLTNYSDGGTFTVYGGTLGGNGLISGAVDIKNGGTIAPGNGIGTLTLTSGLTLESGSTNLFEVTNGAAGDLLAVQGNLTVQTNSTIAISVLGAALEPTTNTLITYTGTKSGSFNPTVVIVGGSVDGSVTIDESTPGQINLVVAPQVVITSQPADLIVSTNSPASFTVGATGTAPISYQWYFYGNSTNNTPVLESGGTNSTFTIASAQTSDTGLYAVVVSNSYNSVMSRFASLIVGNVIPDINGPFDQTVIQGNNAIFSASVVIANPSPTFQWQTNGVDVDDATNTSLTLTNVQYDALNNARISLIASNAAGSVTNNATLTVTVTPAITPQPANLMVNVGDTAVFSSGATGVPTPALQWYKNGALISNQTNDTLTISGTQGSDIAGYELVAANAAGSVTSSVATLTVNSTALVATAFAPTNGATGVCYDTPLYVTFNGPISIINSGKIRIYDSTNSITPVDTIDMSSNTVVVSGGIGLTNNIQPHSLFSGDSQVVNYFPVIITGNTAAIYPHGGVLTSNQTYYVTMDNGIVADSTGAYFAGVSDTNAWQFTTKPTGPANPTNLVVAADGSGDFATVQGAVDSITPGNTNYILVNIHDGNYVEIVDISGKNNITFNGQSRAGTVVGYPNNNNLTGTTAARMAFKVNSSDITLENLTITNGTPQGGSQAEALLIYNNGLRCVVENCDIKSRQDTILINQNTSQGYFYYCGIYGNFDYIWGVGVGYFDHCSFHTIVNSLSSSYNLTAARTATSTSLSATTPWVNPNGTTYSAYGFSFVYCTFAADPGVANVTLAGSNGTAGGLDSWALSQFDTNSYVGPGALTNTYVFWQYSNTDLSGNPVSFPGLTTIGVTNNDPRLLAATNPIIWFSGWSPVIATNTPPVFTAPPAGTNITINVGVNLSVACTATDSDTPAQTLTYSLLPGFPPGAAIDSTSGNFTWRPTVGQANSVNPVSVVVTDSGTPNLSTTNSFTVTVNPLTQPDVGSVSFAGGQFSLTVTGQVGPDYAVQVSTNLLDWDTLFITNSPASPFSWVDTNTSVYPTRFYRVKVGPPLP